MAVINLQDRHSIYPIWLRFFTFFAAIVAAFILLGPSFSFCSSDPSLPWNEEIRILPPGQSPTRTPSADQPKLTDLLHYKTQALLDGGQRGNINFIIYPEIGRASCRERVLRLV